VQHSALTKADTFDIYLQIFAPIECAGPFSWASAEVISIFQWKISSFNAQFHFIENLLKTVGANKTGYKVSK